MLKLTLKPNSLDDRVHIGNDITVIIDSIDVINRSVKISVEAPKDIVIDRRSVRERRIDKIKKIIED